MWPFSTIKKLKNELEYAKVRMAEDDIEFTRLRRVNVALRSELENENATSASLLKALDTFKANAGKTIADLTAQLEAATAKEATTTTKAKK
jgi:hypothetical protein